MNDPFLVGVLHGLADRDEQLQALLGREIALVAILGEGDALNQLHHEVGPTVFGGSRIMYLRDIRMVHQCQGLLLRFEAGNHLAGIHPRLDDFQRHLAAHWPLLLR